MSATGLMTGCSAPAADAAPRTAAEFPEYGATPGAVCRHDSLARFVGKVRTAALIEQARVASRAATVRTIRPGFAVTQDHRSDRLNVDLDAAGKVTRLRCW